jgi:hypothetical protein
MIAATLALALLLQVSPQSGEPVLPVLAFPEPGLDDTAAYQGYQTRFYRDSRENTLQIYHDARSGRIVNIWANALDESIGFTIRDRRGNPARVRWDTPEARVSDSEPTTSLEYHLVVSSPDIRIGWFVLGSMRVERDFQYANRQRLPFSRAPFLVAEESLLVADVARLPDRERVAQLSLLHAGNIAELRARLQPVMSAGADTGSVRVSRPSLDGRNHLTLQLTGNPDSADVDVTGPVVRVRSRSSNPVHLTFTVSTDAAPLSPLSRGEIFNQEFLRFLEAARVGGDTNRYRRLEREVRGVELLSSKEKLMAGMPTFATYFGRDMMMTALMMRPIWTSGMAEHVIASVLRKLGPRGDVSHEEALGGQAIRENAVVYDSLIKAYGRSKLGGAGSPDSILSQARDVLEKLQATRENYHMIDDEYQLAVLAARYLTDTNVPAPEKRKFLADSSDGRGSRLSLLLRELTLVADATSPYVKSPRPLNLVSFPKRDSTHWRSASWRDSDAGYAGGRFAMDINAIWVPHALNAVGQILSVLPSLGFGPDTLTVIAPSLGTSALGQYVRDSTRLRVAIRVWQGAWRHFLVRVPPSRITRQTAAKLASLPAGERTYWRNVSRRQHAERDSLIFLALSLDTRGRPIPVVNTDPATGLFLESSTAGFRADTDAVLRAVAPFVRPYPVGLFVEGLGPLVANDTYASPAVWQLFRDAYHSPRVVWGREVNLFFLGVAGQIAGAYEAGGKLKSQDLAPYVGKLHDVLEQVLRVVDASGLRHNELWSYRVENGRLLPTRYGTSGDIQLWNTTDLAVQFVLSRLPRRSP